MTTKIKGYGNHPLVKYVRSLEGDLFLRREAAEQLDCSQRWLIQIGKSTTPPLGPTHSASYGGILLYLYTQERINEIAAEMKRRGPKPGHHNRGPISMWTRTERYQRDLDAERGRRHHYRAADYRERGMFEKAEESERRSTELAADLERTRLERWEQVHGKPWAPSNSPKVEPEDSNGRPEREPERQRLGADLGTPARSRS